MKPNKRLQENHYDQEGLRVEMVESGQITRFVFHQKERLSELDEKDQLVGFYQRGHGVEGILQDQERTCVLKDEHRSTIFILDQDHEIRNQYRYDTFGIMEEKKELIDNRILYTGQQYDGVADQYYLRARYYNPVVGRFLQEDVYRGDGLNLYAYCGNHPVKYYDPSGYSKGNPNYSNGGITEGSGNPREVNIHGKINSELDEVDLGNKIIYEDKNASKLYMDNPDFPQTEQQWANKQIHDRGSNRINALQQDDFKLSGPDSSKISDIQELKDIKDYVFRVDADTPELRAAVQAELDNLKTKYPDYNFSATFGGSN